MPGCLPRTTCKLLISCGSFGHSLPLRARSGTLTARLFNISQGDLKKLRSIQTISVSPHQPAHFEEKEAAAMAKVAVLQKQGCHSADAAIVSQ